MKKFLPLIVIVAACSSNSGNTNYQTEDRQAIAPFDVPLFATAEDISAAKQIKTLKPGEPVYITDDSITNSNTKYVKVMWGDSTAYAPMNYLLQRGRLAVVLGKSAANREIYLYADPELNTIRMKVEELWTLVAAIPTSIKSSTIVLSSFNGKPVRGYISASQVNTSPTDVSLYFAYAKAEDIDKPALLSSSVYSNSFLAKRINELREASNEEDSEQAPGNFDGEDVYADGDAEYGDYPDEAEEGGPSYDEEGMNDFETQENWSTPDNDPIPTREQAGTFTKYIVFTDDTEIPAGDHYLSGGFARKEAQSPPIEKPVKSVRFEFVPNRNCSIFFMWKTWDGLGPKWYSDGNQTVAHAESGKPYSITIQNTDNKPLTLCNSMSVTCQVDQQHAVLTMHGECAD